MALNYEPNIIDDGSGQEYQALTAECNCGEDSDVFFVFQIAGLDHLHFQCAQCDQSYCPNGVCLLPQVPQPGDY